MWLLPVSDRIGAYSTRVAAELRKKRTSWKNMKLWSHWLLHKTPNLFRYVFAFGFRVLSSPSEKEISLSFIRAVDENVCSEFFSFRMSRWADSTRRVARVECVIMREMIPDRVLNFLAIEFSADGDHSKLTLLWAFNLHWETLISLNRCRRGRA